MTSRTDFLIEAAAEYAQTGNWDGVFDAYSDIVQENPWLGRAWLLFGYRYLFSAFNRFFRKTLAGQSPVFLMSQATGPVF